MQQYNKTKGIRGIYKLYGDAIRLRDMITQSAQERARILTFWKKHGDRATQEAFHTSRSTLFRWQGVLDKSGGNLESLVPQSTAPHIKRSRIIPQDIQQLIISERSMERIGKEKLAILIKQDRLGIQSPSTVGRMMFDMKKRGLLPHQVKYTLSGKTGRMIEKKPRAYRMKLRSKGHTGALVKADTIVRFTNGIKRYILTGIDCETKFTFAYAYTSHTSQTATDFMNMFRNVAPLSLTHIQTDNGSEFEHHFEAYCDKENIIHFHSYPRTPKMQSEIERFNRTLSEAFISHYRHLLAYDIESFNRKLMDWLIWYNTRRPHWSIGLISPLRYITNTLTTEKSQMLWTSTIS